MTMFNKAWRLALRAAPLTAGLVLVAGFAGASVPDGVGVIHGCYAPWRFGILRVIDTAKGQTCQRWEKSLDWNQAGPPAPSPSPTSGSDPGSGVAARLQWGGAQDVMDPGGTDITIGSWTQHAGEVDTIVPGTATLTIDAGCTLTDLPLNVRVSGLTYGSGRPVVFSYDLHRNLGSNATGEVRIDVPLGVPQSDTGMPASSPTLFEPSADTDRTLEATADGTYDCSGPGAVRLVGVTFDVLAAR
jgi:hypothetical protein